MAFKMKNPSLMKMAKAAGDNRVAMKMKAESAAKMKKSPMKAEGKPSDESKDNVRQAKDLVKEMKKQRKASRKADTAANKQARKDDRVAKAADKAEVKAGNIQARADKKIRRADAKAQRVEDRVTGYTKAARQDMRANKKKEKFMAKTDKQDARLIAKEDKFAAKTAKKAAKRSAKAEKKFGRDISAMTMKKESSMKMGHKSPKKLKKSAMKLDDKKDTRTAEKKTEDFNRKHSERLGTTATYNPEASKKAGKNVYTVDKSNQQMAAEHRARFERNVRKNDPNITDKEMDEAYKNRKRK